MSNKRQYQQKNPVENNCFAGSDRLWSCKGTSCQGGVNAQVGFGGRNGGLAEDVDVNVLVGRSQGCQPFHPVLSLIKPMHPYRDRCVKHRSLQH